MITFNHLLSLFQSIFSFLGVVILFIAAVMLFANIQFRSNSMRVAVRVIDHFNQDAALPVFEVIDTEHAGKQDTMKLAQPDRVYPISSEWPAWFDPKTGNIKADHMIRDSWIMIIAFCIIGLVFFFVSMFAQIAYSDHTLISAFFCLGGSLVAFGIIYTIRENHQRRRLVPASASLVDFYSITDRDGQTRFRAVLKIETGHYRGVHTSDTWINRVDQNNIGMRFNGEFDPFSFRYFVTDKRFQAPNLGAIIAFTGIGFMLMTLGIRYL